MKHLLNNLSEEEKNSIREQHEGGMRIVNENFKKLVDTKLGDVKPLVNEQLGSGIAANVKGLGARIGTVAQNLGKAVNSGQGNRTLSSPKLNAQMAKIQSKVKSLQNVITDLTKDLTEIQQVAQTEKTGQYQSEATQIETMINNYNQVLGQVNEYNNYLLSQSLQAPQLQQPAATAQQPAATAQQPK